jgi:hypothetical protein
MLNNNTLISKESKTLLNTIIRTAHYFSKSISQVSPVAITGLPADLQRDIALPYMILIYGKILTVYRLLNGYNLEDLHPKMVGVSNDSYSCYDIIRALYECFLQANFIVSRYETDDEKHYISLWWHIRAFSERSIMAKNRAMKNTKLDQEAIDIESYKTLIDTSYAGIRAKDVQQFGPEKKKSDWPAWPKAGNLNQMAGIHDTHHKHFYKRNSLYAHSEPFALMQLGTHHRLGKDDLDGAILSQGTEVIYLSVLALKSFSMIFKPIEVLFENDEDLQAMYAGAVNTFGRELPRKKALED